MVFTVVHYLFVYLVIVVRHVTETQVILDLSAFSVFIFNENKK